MTHIDFKTMLRYISNIASDNEQLEVDIHMSDCKHCYTQISALQYLKNNFWTVFENFTIEKYAEAQHQLKYLSILMEATNKHPDLKSKLVGLYTNIREGFTISAKLLIDSGRRLSLIAPDNKAGWEMDAGFYMDTVYNGIGDSESTAAAQKLEQSRKFLNKSMKDNAVDLMADITKIKPELVESSKLLIKSQQREIGYVDANSLTKTLEIVFYEFKKESPPSLVILTDTSGGVILTELQLDDNDWLIAEVSLEEGISEIKII